MASGSDPRSKRVAIAKEMLLYYDRVEEEMKTLNMEDPEDFRKCMYILRNLEDKNYKKSPTWPIRKKNAFHPFLHLLEPYKYFKAETLRIFSGPIPLTTTTQFKIITIRIEIRGQIERGRMEVLSTLL